MKGRKSTKHGPIDEKIDPAKYVPMDHLKKPIEGQNYKTIIKKKEHKPEPQPKEKAPDPILIPQIIHQTWKTKDLPEEFRENAQKWKNLHPTYEYRFYTDEGITKYVQDFFPQLYPFFMGMTSQIERVDLWRYLVMLKDGGIYCDLDTIPLQPFDSLFTLNLQSSETTISLIILGEEPKEHMRPGTLIRKKDSSPLVGNAIILSPPGKKFWADLVDYIIKNYHHNSDPVDTTGPGAIKNFLGSDKSKNPYAVYSIYLRGPSTFYPLTNKKTKNTHIHSSGLVMNHISDECYPVDESKVYAIHTFANTWVPKTLLDDPQVWNKKYWTIGIVVALIGLTLAGYYFYKKKKYSFD